MMSRSIPVLSSLLALALAGCGGDSESLPPRGQILLFVDTDAPLPPAPGTAPAPGALPWLFDRLRVQVKRGAELLRDDEALADEEFSLHADRFDDGPVSMGIAPEPNDDGLVVRVRLYRGDRVRAGEPLPSGVIESNVRLPAVGSEGVQRVYVELRVDDTGSALGQPAPLAPVTDPPASSLVGSWAGATIVPCVGEPLAGEACVPGGAFWFGDPDLRGNPELLDADRERLLIISPFFLDRTEVTVAEFRELANELEQLGHALPPEWNGSSDASELDDYATFTPARHPNDPDDAHAALALNGVSWSTARAYCQLLGKDLPSEAMLEFAASGRGLENDHVWGNDEPTCDAAVVGRAGVGVYANFEGACRPTVSIGGVLAPGSSARDQLELEPDGEPVVSDLAGNLSEWTVDWLTEQDEPPWAEPGVLRDPVALETGRHGMLRSVRGASWRDGFIALRAAARWGRTPEIANRSVGFRCARTAAP